MTNSNLKKLAEEIVFSYEARIKVIKEIVEDTHKMLNGFKQSREEMSSALQETLAKSRYLRKTDFSKIMDEILVVQLEREENVKQMLADFQREEEKVIMKLKKLLDKGQEIKIKDFKKMIAKIKEEQKEREKTTGQRVGEQMEGMQTEVHAMLTMLKQEREKMTSGWKTILASIQNTQNKKIKLEN